MKFHKSLILFVSLFFLTGCYTQLQYSQRVHRITDEPRTPRTYTEETDQRAKADKAYGDNVYRDENDYEEGYEHGYYDGTEDAFYYKDYAAAEWYARHGFGRFYHDYFPHYYGSSHWRHYRSFYNPYFYNYYPRSYASISFGLHFGYSWGAFYGFPHHWYRYRTHYYWDPYYGYGFGYSPIFVNNYIYSGYAGYVGVGKHRDEDRRYGRRSIGTNRVRSDVNNGNVRSRGTNVERQNTPQTTTVRSRSNTTVDRSRGTVRSRSSSDNTSRVRSTGRSGSSSGRSDDGSSGTRRSRGNDYNVSQNVDSDNQQSRETRYSRYRNYDLRELNRERIRNRLEDRRIELNTKENDRRSRSNFIDQVQKKIQINRNSRNSFNSDNNTRNRSNSSTNVRSRSSSSSNNRGTVSSSRNKSSSRGTRSSGGSGSSNRSRSRGN